MKSIRYFQILGLFACVISTASVSSAQHTFSISLDAGGTYKIDGEVPRVFDPGQPIIGRPVAPISTTDPTDLSVSASYLIAFGAESPVQPLFGVAYGFSRSHEGSSGGFSTLGIFAGLTASAKKSTWQPFASIKVGPTFFFANDDLKNPSQFDSFYLAGYNMIGSIDYQGRLHYGAEAGLKVDRYSFAVFFAIYGARVTYFTVSEDVIPNARLYPSSFKADVTASRYGLRVGISL